MNDFDMNAALQGEYRNVFAQAESFGMISDLDRDFLAECLTDLGDLLLTAQERGTPVEKVTGKDTEAFCRSFFSEFTLKNRAACVCKTIFKDVWFVLVINLLLIAGETGSDFFAIRTNSFSGWFLVFNFLYILFYNVLFSTAMRRVWFRIRYGEWIQTIGTIAIVVLSALIGTYFEDVLCTIPAYVMALVSGGYILCYLLVSLGSRYRRTGHLYDPEKRQRRMEKRAQKQTQREKAFVTLMAQRYDRQNEARRAKGQPEISRETYMELFQKENRRMNLYLLMVVLAAVWFFFAQYQTCSWWATRFAGPAFALDGAVLVLIWYLFFSPYVFRIRQAVEAKCRQKGMDILAYAAWLNAEAEAD